MNVAVMDPLQTRAGRAKLDRYISVKLFYSDLKEDRLMSIRPRMKNDYKGDP
jgi:hypothetical protein